MNKKIGIKILFIFFIFGLLMPNVLSGQNQKIRVVVKNSSIRLEPDVQSGIIDSPPLGAVFEVIEKMDVWYKVKLDSDRYGRADGYINKMFVEELMDAEKPHQEIEKEPEIQKKDIEVKAKGEKIKEEEKTLESQAKKGEKEKSEKIGGGAAGTGEDEDKIKTIVNEYILALKNNRLLLFYEQMGTSEFYFEVKEDTEWMSRSYNRINSCVSDISVQLKNSQEAEVRISLIITGLPRMGGSRKLLFEGIYIWDMIKQNNEWKIAGANSQAY
jgi:hypothetical protein